jgi:hypothetical protein
VGYEVDVDVSGTIVVTVEEAEDVADAEEKALKIVEEDFPELGELMLHTETGEVRKDEEPDPRLRGDWNKEK